MIGGPVPAAGNLIAFNQPDGVQVEEGERNQILSNLIHSDGEEGIESRNQAVPIPQVLNTSV